MKKVYLAIFSILIFVTSCSDETTHFDQQSVGRALVLEESNTILYNGINESNNGILDIYFEHEISSKNGNLLSNTTSDFHLNLVGQVSSPNFEGSSNLTATHVDYLDQFAYVSYNTLGETFAGAVDVIDLSNPLSPILASRMYMYNRDANVILYDNGYLYVLGGVNAEMVLEATGESFIAKIGVRNGIIDLGDVSYFYQEGNTATGITKMQNSYYVSSGIDGSIAKYDGNTFLKSKEVAFNDLRSVASENGKLAILDGDTGVTIMDGELNVLSQITTSSSFVEDAKRTIAITDSQVIVSEGAQGAGVYNLNTGALEERLSILIDPENVAASDKVTNAVSVNGNATLLANGGAGLAIKVKNELVDLMGVVELKGSINYVVSDGDYIFAASGNSGLQIINKIRTQESLIIPEGDYIIRSRKSGRAMALTGLSSDNGTNIVQLSQTGQAENEQWNLEILDSGAYVIRSTYSNSVAQKSNPGYNVQQWEYEGTTRQQWAIEPAAEEGYFYIRNIIDSRYLDVSGGSTRSGGTIITWRFHGGTNQQWLLEKLED
ncbi:MAG: RICIN domain-containing protein [Maribacter sp.]